MQAWTETEAQKIALTLRTMNYNVGMQMYTMVFITTLEGISAISHALSGVPRNVHCLQKMSQDT